MKNCEKINTCKDAKNGFCKHYRNHDGYPCEYEANYWEEFAGWDNKYIDEKHRFPIYKKGEEFII